MGMDGIEHFTLATLRAMKQRDRAKKNLHMDDIRVSSLNTHVVIVFIDFYC